MKFAWALVLLAFLSKVSLDFTGLVPRQLGFLIFQGGIHPYLNVLLNFSLSFLLLRIPEIRKDVFALKQFHFAYRTFAIGTMIILFVQSLLQTLVGIEVNPILLVATLSSTFLLITIFGLVLPRIIPAEDFVNGVAKICFWITAISIALYLIGMPAMFKGNRFVGILKHIPFMVTCTTAGFLFNLNQARNLISRPQKIIFTLQQLIFLIGILLTGTRSALSAAMAGALAFFLLYQGKEVTFRLARILIVWIFLVATVLFGGMAYDFGKAVMTGEKAIGQREAQDGVGDRIDEVYRGLDLLEKHPHVGLGLLSKFSSADSEDVVESYNSFQDPHNLFVSSGVVAGWPFAVFVIFGFVCLGIASFSALLSGKTPMLTLGVYLLSHLPILFIYHMHLSLGGLADRLYWLCFGYISLNSFQKNHEKNITPEV